MHLAGYPLSALLGVFAAAGFGAVLLYILKLRRRPVPVVFSPIWRRVLGDRESSKLFSQLKRPSCSRSSSAGCRSCCSWRCSGFSRWRSAIRGSGRRRATLATWWC
jgi:hypothetical protein